MHLLLPLFALSGWAGLGYQVLWSKYLLGFIGVSALSYAAVLSVFMGGLALGSRYLGQALDRIARPLKFYGILELLLGIYSILLFEPLLSLMGELYLEASGNLESGWILIGFRAILAALVLLFPTILMGGTYPAVLKASLRTDSGIARNSGLLYGINALGAALGSLGMAFWILPSYGLAASLQIMGILNLLLALWAFLIREPACKDQNTRLPYAPPSFDSLDLSAGLCGFFTFSLEIGWTRFFSLSLGSTTYSFSLVIATFITGIGLGGLVASRIRPGSRSLGFCLLGAGSYILFTLPIQPYFPLIFKGFSQMLQPIPSAYWIHEGGKILLATCLMLPATFLSGMILPMLIPMKARSRDSIGMDSGRIYAINTMGNVLGALTGALFFLPWLGLQNLLSFSALGLCLIGLYHLSRNSRPVRFPLILTATLASISLFWRWEPLMFSFVPTRISNHLDFNTLITQTLQNSKALYVRDDPSASVLVVEDSNQKPITRRLYVNGKVDASDTTDMSTQILLAQLPLLFHSDPENALVIGYGSGVTAGSILTHPLKNLDIVELSSGVIEASHLFSHVNHQPLQDPRTRLHTEDALSYLKASSNQWDILISEPSNPWIAGIGNLFTLEFYETVRERLKADGVFCQWLQLYESSTETTAIVLATLRSVFPNTLVFQDKDNFLILASEKPLHLQENHFLTEEMKKIGILNLENLLMQQVLTNEDGAVIASSAPIYNTADNLYLEYQAPRELFLRKKFRLPPLHNSAILMSPGHLLEGTPPSRLTSDLHQIESELESEIAETLWNAGRFTPNVKALLKFPEPEPELYLRHLKHALQNEDPQSTELLLLRAFSRILVESRFLNSERDIWWSGLQDLAERHSGKSNFLHFLVANLARERGQNEVLRSQILATRAPYTGAIGPRLILLSRHSAPDLLPGLIQKMGDGEQAGIQALFSELHALEELESIYRSIGENHVRTGPNKTE